MKRGSNIESSPSPFREEDDVYYKVVRLKTGESILCSMNNNVTVINSEPVLTLLNPVQAVLSKQVTKDDNVVSELYILRPWVGLSDSKEFSLPTEICLTIGDMKPATRKQYIDYLNETVLAERILRKEEEEEKMNKAIYHLLTEVNGGKKVYIVKVDED